MKRNLWPKKKKRQVSEPYVHYSFIWLKSDVCIKTCAGKIYTIYDTGYLRMKGNIGFGGLRSGLSASGTYFYK